MGALLAIGRVIGVAIVRLKLGQSPCNHIDEEEMSSKDKNKERGEGK